MLKKILPIIVLVLIIIAFFYKVVFFSYVLVDMSALSDKLPWSEHLSAELTEAGHPYRHSDSSSLYFPIFKFYSKQLKEGRLPLWMPTLSGGYPILANSTSLILNPFTIFLLLPKSALGYSWALIAKLFLAGLGLFLYLRLLKIRRIPALFGSAAYMFNSLAMLKLEIPWMTQCLWGIPFIFFFIEKTIRRKKLYFSMLAAIFLALQFVGGHPQTGLYVTLFVLLYALGKLAIRIKRQGWQKNKKLTLLLILPFVLLPLLSAMQLIPMFELQGQGHRTPNEPPQWLSPAHLLTAVIPKLFGSTKASFELIAKIERNILRAFNLDFPLITLPYLGLAPLLFGLGAAFKKFRADKYIKFFSRTVLALVILHLTAPLWSRLARNIPFVNTMWNTYRLNVIYVFAFSILSAFGFNYFLEKPRAFKKIIAKILTILIVIFGFTTGSALIFQKYFKNILTESQDHFSFKSSTFYLPIILLLFIALLFIIFYKKKMKKRTLAILLFAITVCDLFLIGWFYNPILTKKNDVFPEIEAIELLQEDHTLYRVMETDGWHVIFPNSLSAYDISDVGLEENIYPLRYNEYMSFVESSERASLDNPFHTNITLTRYNSPLLDVFNVKYIITPPDQAIKEKEFKLVYDQEVRIYENKKVLPRAFLVPQVKIIEDKKEILNALADPKFEPLQTAIFEEKPKIEGSNNLQGSSLVITEYKSEEIKIKTRLTEDGFLILSDTYYPGWQVLVDGEKDKIYRANYIGRGVALPAGDHEVVFRFKPKSVKLGFYISLLTLGIIMSITAITIFKKQKKNSIKKPL